MGNYFNPAGDIQKVGREIAGSSWHDLSHQLKNDELLFAFSGWFAALVDNENTFQVLNELYGKPPLSLRYFAVPIEAANKGLDYPVKK